MLYKNQGKLDGRPELGIQRFWSPPYVLRPMAFSCNANSLPVKNQVNNVVTSLVLLE
jgi:hypothetical protein